MTPSSDDIQKLQKQLNDAQSFVQTIQASLNEARLQNPNQAEARSPRHASFSQPRTIEEDGESVEVSVRPKRRRDSIDSRKTGHSTMVDGRRQRVTSVDLPDDSSDSDEGESFFAQEPLPEESFDEDGLRDHLDGHNFDVYSELILQDVLDRHRYQKRESIFETDTYDDEGDHDAQHHDVDVYEIDRDGAPRPKIREDSKKGGDHSQLWEVLRHTNADKEQSQKAVGRIVVMREPTTLLCAALHYTMSPHFDMDSIFRIMIDDTITTRAYVNGHMSKDPRQQRSIVFVLKYHTLIGKGRTPLMWQNHDDDLVQTRTHVPISSCSAVVALSLAGKPARFVRSHSRKSKKRDQVSTLYDPFNPWHVLSLQCFPDWNSETNIHETKHHYVNGPDAFLATLLNEYRDATKRFKELNKCVVDLATAPKEVMFNEELRDDLLFEHGDFKWSRRYFWAAQALQILAEEIQAMITAYEDTFTEEFWAGEHKTLFVGTADVSARYSNFRKKIAHTHKGFEKEIKALRDVLKKCNTDQKHITRQREWLFSGTSVLESRSARKQDYNIKLLTVVTIIFLPLMFVTSVFGMTNITADEGFRRFGIATVCISVPTYWLLILISWREKITPLKIAITNKCRTLLGKKAKVGVVRRSYKSKDRKHLKATQKNAINASLQRRLTSMSSTQGGRGSIGQADQELDELGAKNRSVSPAPIPRRATVQFEETLQRPSRHETAIIAEPSPNTSDVDVAESMRRANRATSMPEGTDRNGTAPRRSSLLRRFSSSSGVEAPPVCPV